MEHLIVILQVACVIVNGLVLWILSSLKTDITNHAQNLFSHVSNYNIHKLTPPLVFLFALLLLGGCSPLVNPDPRVGPVKNDDIFALSPWLFALMFGFMVAGAAWSGFTRTKYGWTLSAYSAAGICLLIAFKKFQVPIAVATTAAVVVTITYKMIQYHRERNKALDANKTNQTT